MTRRRPPPWWPDGEPWPPAGPWKDGDRWRDGWRRRGHPWRPFGCLFILFGAFAIGTIVVGIWSAAAIVGAVHAPPIVVVAGIVAFVLVAIGAAAAARASRRVSRPLEALIEAAGRVETGDYSVRVDVSGTREMRSLVRAFNQMSERLEAGDARRRAFLADVAHELRTPLTIVQGQLEAIADGIYVADRARVEALLGQTRAMTALVEDLGTISLAEVGALGLHPEPTELWELLDEVVAAHALGASGRGVELRTEARSGSVMALVDRGAMRRVLANVVANALRATPSGGSVTLGAHVASRDGQPGIVVRDTGAGIPPELLPHVFDRFVKGQASEGSGLGLAIARELVVAQGGTIELASEVASGTTVSIALCGVLGQVS